MTRCDHCSLPLGRRIVRDSAAGDGSSEPGRFCCTGCLLAAQITRARGEPAVASALMIRLGLACFFAMNVMVVSLPTYAPYVYGEKADGGLFIVLRVLGAVFTIPVLGLLGAPIARGALGGLTRGRANADTLVCLAVLAAYGLSLAHIAQGVGDTYFDTATMLLVLVTLGRYLEARARAEATARLRKAAPHGPTEATLLREGARVRVEPGQLRPGDVVEVGPGNAFPTDGVVIRGRGAVDESMLTGEAHAVPKESGEHVAGGTVPTVSRYTIRVERPAAESAHARLADLTEHARSERAPIERMADGAAAALTPLVVLVALAATVRWWQNGDPSAGILVGVSILVVACPCAFGIATPLALWVGLDEALRRGVVLRSGSVLEQAAKIRRVIVDKTGTLTSRIPSIDVAWVRDGLTAPHVLAQAAALEDGIAHPIARGIEATAREAGAARLNAYDVAWSAGHGVSGTLDGEALSLSSGDPGEVLLRGPEGVRAAFRVEERLRNGAHHATARLQATGIGVELATGDTSAGPAAEVIQRCHVGQTPEQKLDLVGARNATQTAMVGDGINDGPALAAAGLGVAIGDASDLARMSADAVLLRSDLSQLPWLLEHGRNVRRIARQNLVWALVYNGFAVALAATGALTPVVSALAMIASSILVVANSQRVRGRGSEPSSLPIAPVMRPAAEELP